MKNYLHKSLSIVLVLTLVLGLFSGLSFQSAASVPSSGKCGENVTYTFDSFTGLLTISGSGAMTNYGLSNSPFYNQKSIKSIVINNGITRIGNNSFYKCSELTSVTIPNSVTSIGGSAFSGCSGLTSVTIPGSVTKIVGSAFCGCSGLTSITVANNNKKYDSRDNCNAIIETDTNTLIDGCKKTVIPDSVTSIGSDAFRNCSSLTSIIIPNSVTSIGNYAFESCSGLTSIIIPNSVTSIGDSAFSGCSGLTSVSISNSVTSIGYAAFRDCSNLTSITIPDSITSIGSSAFLNCSGLTSVTIPDSVTSIGSSAFLNCSGLTSVTIPDSVTSIGSSAFYGCSGLTRVHIFDLEAWCKINFYYDSNPLRYAHKLYLNNTLVTDLEIPDSITSIGNESFYGCDSLTSITIPNSVTSIGDFAFDGCSGLTSIIIPNSVTSIGGSAFYNCSGLTSVTIPDSVTSIGERTFCSCSSLTNITIPNSVTSIGGSAFLNCSGLTSVTIPDSVTSIGSGAFCCTGLKNLAISNSVTSIESQTFSGCRYLTSVTIPASVTSIGKQAFSGCVCLKYIDIKGNRCTIDSEKYSDLTIPAATTIIINGSKEVYEYAKKYNNQYICNHVEIIDNAKEPTCTNSGLSDGSHCKVCGTVLKRQITTALALGHDYHSKITSPTCTKKGFTTHTCSRCGNSFVDGETDALGHNYVAQMTAPTCTEKGFITYTCSRCTDSYTDDYTVATGHSPAETVKENEITATCTSSGSFDAVVYCSVCRSELSRDHKTVSALGHDIVIDQVKSPTCTENGFSTQGSHCARCNEILIEQEIIPALGHDWTNWSVVTAPEGCKNGLSIRICNTCNAIENLAIPASGTHTPAIAVKENETAPTCIVEGSYEEVVKCSVCGEELSRTAKTVPALGHTYKAVTTKPTGTTLGYSTHTCSLCGDSFNDSYTAPTGKLTLKHSARTANAIKVQWNNVKTATGYQVQISTKDGKKWSTYANLKAGVTNYTFKKLAAGNNYKFRVRFYIKTAEGNKYSPWSTTLNSPTLPKGTMLTKLTSAKKAFNAQWKKNASVNGYQVQYGVKSNFSGAKTLTVKNAKTLKAAVKKLSAKKVYYVRIRTYKTISKVNYFSAWSKTYKVKTK